ncbi:FAD:protein FMN transferase [Streptomyces sp. NPDC058683]|uniref:FAD:protein FMN transferase n=1 Tax=Streptomyces sp. NPDC058683 TaxID=3346597 RepID=UPI003663C415
MSGAPLRQVVHVMGTVFSFDVRDAETKGRLLDVEDALHEAADRLHRIDALYSTYREDSAVSRLDRGEATPDTCEPEVARVLAACAEAERETDGWFNLRSTGRLDPSGYVKGWAVTEASRILQAAGSRRHSICGGGDVQTSGGPAPGQPWRIGIAHPLRPGRLAAIVAHEGLAVATSGTAERGCHIVNPHTGEPATGLASLTVVGRDLARADIWATAGFAMGADWLDALEAAEGLEALAVLPDGELRYTSGFHTYTATAPVG